MDFLASLRDSLGNLGIAIQSGTLSITDYSNYDTSTEAGHEQADFTLFRKISVTNPAGTEYLFSTLGDGDQLIDVPSVITPPDSVSYTYGDDGVYTVVLYVVPTWKSLSSGTYSASDDYVYYGGKFYKCILDATTQAVTNTTYWTEVLITDLSVKYQVEEKYVITACLEECYAKLVVAAECSDFDTQCSGTELCANEAFITANVFKMTLEAINTYASVGYWNKVVELVNAAKAECSTC